MIYVDFTAGNKNYRLRLNTRNTIALEKALGTNPLAIFGDGETLPTVIIKHLQRIGVFGWQQGA